MPDSSDSPMLILTGPSTTAIPRPPKAIERCVEADTLREVLDHWDGRGTRSPAQLTDGLDDLDHQIDAADDRLTNRIDAIESKLQRAIPNTGSCRTRPYSITANLNPRRLCRSRRTLRVSRCSHLGCSLRARIARKHSDRWDWCESRPYRRHW